MSYPHKNDAKEFFIHFSGTRGLVVYDGFKPPFKLRYEREWMARFEILPHIGMLDENRREIYKSDIVQYGNYTQKYKGVIDFDKCAFIARCFSYKSDEGYSFFPSKNSNYTLASFNAGWYYSVMSLHGWNEVEVIGNIFENPELVTNK